MTRRCDWPISWVFFFPRVLALLRLHVDLSCQTSTQHLNIHFFFSKTLQLSSDSWSNHIAKHTSRIPSPNQKTDRLWHHTSPQYSEMKSFFWTGSLMKIPQPATSDGARSRCYNTKHHVEGVVKTNKQTSSYKYWLFKVFKFQFLTNELMKLLTSWGSMFGPLSQDFSFNDYFND